LIRVRVEKTSYNYKCGKGKSFYWLPLPWNISSEKWFKSFFSTIHYALLSFLALIVFLPAGLSVDRYIGVHLLVLAIIVLILAFVNLLYGMLSQVKYIKTHTIDIIFCICVLIRVIYYLIYSNKIYGFSSLFLIVAMFTIYLCCRIHKLTKIESINIFLIFIFVAFLNNIVGLWQVLLGYSMSGFLSSINYHACYTGIHVPLAIGLYLSLRRLKNNRKTLFIRYLLIACITLFIVTLVITCCRTALVAVFVSLLLFIPSIVPKIKRLKKSIDFNILFILSCIIILSLFIGTIFFLYNIKRASISGRSLVWKISKDIAQDNMLLGIKPGNFPKEFARYQALYFENQTSNSLSKMSADFASHPYSSILLDIDEYGLPANIIFFTFWVLILITINHVILISKPKIISTNTHVLFSHGNYESKKDYIIIGVAGTIMAIIIISTIYTAYYIIPILILFYFSLATIVNKISGTVSHKLFDTNGYCVKINSWYYSIILGILTIIMIVSLLYYGSFYQTWRDFRTCYFLCESKDYKRAFTICTNLYPKLKWCGQYLHFCGDAYLSEGLSENAIKCYKEAENRFPDPFMLENMGIAYIKSTNTLEALYYWKKASFIQPWRLTPKYYLADLFYQLGETNEAIKYARLVVNTPMKKWTERGKEFKLKSQKMLVAMNQKCDDPGLIVFDINEKKTWNEGLW